MRPSRLAPRYLLPSVTDPAGKQEKGGLSASFFFLALAFASAGSAQAVVGVMLFPLVVRAFGLIASILGVVMVRVKGDEDPMRALTRGYMVTAVLAAIGFVGGTYWLLNPPGALDAFLANLASTPRV